MSTTGVDYSVRFEVEYPESSSRWRALLGVLFVFPKLALLIPHLVILSFLGIAASVVTYIGYWAVLITGKYPEVLFNFLVGVQRWSARTDSWLYGLADSYPPFSLTAPDYPASYEVGYPESSSRWRALLGVLFFAKIVLLVPHLVVLSFLGIAASVVTYIGYWAVLITGKYPEVLFNFLVGVQRWSARTDSWLYGLADSYPPFSLTAPDYPASYEVGYPESSSRWRALLGGCSSSPRSSCSSRTSSCFGPWGSYSSSRPMLILPKLAFLVPHFAILYGLWLASFAAIYVGYWIALIRGRYPAELFEFVSGVQRWSYRTEAWLAGLTDRYPPLGLR
jgi:hypothetical protein